MAEQKNELQWMSLRGTGYELRQANEGSAGYDLKAAEGGVIEPGKKACIPLDIAIQLPPMTVGIIKSRSSLSMRDLEVGAGVIDCNYRGELKVMLRNFGEGRFEYVRGDRIAQLLILPYLALPPHQVAALDDSNRGAGGFGSTGK
jgi:dUTP pyrophosphatase